MKKILPILALAALPLASYGQSAYDAYILSQSDLRGTARFMSMGGAFGALGGDLSVLSQNPGGIGIYRSNELGVSFDLDMLGSKSETRGGSESMNFTRFNLNNIGGVATIKLKSEAVPNINFGFTYNKLASFNRRYKGHIPQLGTSLSNYIAGIANDWDLTAADVTSTDNFDPYNPPRGFRGAPWITILGYDAMLISPEGDETNPNWYGQYGNGTSGNGNFEVQERGSIDEYNIAIGGNIKDIVYWGIDFGITSVDYKVGSVWNENLRDAYVFNTDANEMQVMNSQWWLNNAYRLRGTGFNFKLGVIVKPIQELRIGFAFHTPTYYNLTETFYNESIDFNYPFPTDYNYCETNYGEPTQNYVDFRTPWRLIASVAGVIGSKFIISADYEWKGYKNMRYSEYTPSDYYYDPWYDWDHTWDDWYGAPAARGVSYSDNPVAFTNQKIREIYRDSNTIRLGAEYRVLPSLSLRLGYSYTSSPFKSTVRSGLTEVPAAGTMANYRIDNDTNYVTAGIGYKHKGFYADLAYIYKHQSSDFYPFSPDPENPLSITDAKISFNTSQVVLSVGYKF